MCYYSRLDKKLSSSSTEDEIKKKYYELAKLYHPDTGKSANAERFKQVTEEYEVLSNVGTRRQYDALRR